MSALPPVADFPSVRRHVMNLSLSRSCTPLVGPLDQRGRSGSAPRRTPRPSRPSRGPPAPCRDPAGHGIAVAEVAASLKTATAQRRVRARIGPVALARHHAVNQGVAEIDIGWLLPNHADYRRRASLEDKKEQDAIRQQVRDCHASVTTPPRASLKVAGLRDVNGPRARLGRGTGGANSSLCRCGVSQAAL
jgi:hypothetical protein